MRVAGPNTEYRVTKVYCTAPWRGLHITTSGDVKPCCSGTHGFGNINNQDLETILASSEWQQLRRQISDNQRPDYCATCVRQGSANNTERTWHNNMSPDLEITDEYQSPAILDVRWSNACNLMCIYCNPYDSSMWARKENFPLLTKRKGYYENVIEYVQNNSNNLKVVALIGGEPLLIPQVADLILALPDTVDCHVITNLSIDLDNNPAYQQLTSRKRVLWSISFDNIGQQFEYVRRGASWNIVDKNLDKLKVLEQTQGHILDIHAVLNILSVASLNSLAEYALDKRIKVVFQYLDNPTALDLRRFPSTVVEQLRAAITIKDSMIDNYFNLLDTKDNQIEEFYNYIKNWETDQLKFSLLWPELHKLLRVC